MPLLLDAAGLLADSAQRAWRQHETASSNWDLWAQSLRSASQVSMTALVTSLQAKMLQQPQPDPLSENLCLLWQCARHVGGDGSSASLQDIVNASKSRNGYLPGLVQEVLLEAFGGQQLAQGVALFANALRVGGTPAAGGGAGGFVRGPDLVTGHGWIQAVAAASEACDVPTAPEPNPEGVGETAASVEQRGAPHFNIADQDDRLGSTGLTQEMHGMEVDRPQIPQVSEDRAMNGRRVRRRRQPQHNSWELLRCTMCQSADAHQAQDSRGLMQHMVRMHLGQALLPETVAQLRALGKEACRICACIRARTTARCSTCGCATATRPLQLGDIVPDRRRGTNQEGSVPAAASPADAANRPTGQTTDSDTEQTQNGYNVRAATVSEASARDAQLLRHLTLEGIPMCVAGRMAICLAEATEACIEGDETWSFLARFRSRLLLATVPSGVDRNEELKRRLRL